MGAITLTGVSKTFDDFTAIAGVDLTVGDGEFVVFVGPSGCGKSTLLRLIADLEDVSAGQVAIDGVDATAMPPVQWFIASRFSTTSSRLLALHSEKPALGSGYIAATVNTPEQEKSFAAFLNSSFGAIQMLHRRTKTLTYPAYEAQHLKTLMLPDPATADLAPLLEAFEAVKDTPLQPRPGPRHHRPMARMAE